ncbi:MFS transporter [Phytoactinopolyspora halophila]|uniref:MFS transporter n=1 Tax=Phytoactinopolyspora halophila TaxID=1981511 RepID=UPI001B8C3952|nr:MFS transporter [Phytoactinopolyspora halophila]
MPALALPRPSSYRPSSYRAPDRFYGWHIVVYATIALAATAPGQTAAVSIFIDPMIAELGISRSAISTAYLIGTLTGAAAIPWVGRALDRFGIRRTMAAIGAVFGTVLIGLAAVSEIVGLTVGFAGIRLAGQGALGLTATSAAALWFTRRRGFATGIVSAIGALGISLTPVALEGFVASQGWRTAWLVEGVLIWAIVVPIALLGMRDRPADLGQLPDGDTARDDGTRQSAEWGAGRAEAARTPYFWVIAAGVAACGLLSTGVNFHQISLLGERGLTPTEAAGNFVWQTIAMLLVTLATGALADRVRPRWLITVMMVMLAVGLVWGTRISPGISAMLFGALLGGAGGGMRVLEATTFPRYFGTAQLGAIRGLVVAVSVGSTAFGPLLFALVHQVAGSYSAVLLWTAPIPLIIAVAALVIAPPQLNAALGDVRRERSPSGESPDESSTSRHAP